jgi:hypothetical protein
MDKVCSARYRLLSMSEVLRARDTLEVERCVYDLVFLIALTPLPALLHLLLILPPPPAVVNTRNDYSFASLVRSVTHIAHSNTTTGQYARASVSAPNLLVHQKCKPFSLTIIPPFIVVFPQGAAHARLVLIHPRAPRKSHLGGYRNQIS